MLVLYRRQNPLLSATWRFGASPSTGNDDSLEENDDGVQATNVRGRIEGAYHDDPVIGTHAQAGGAQLDEAVNDGRTNQGPAMQPSSHRNEGNAWREI